jgi:hypothetical protein
LRKPKANVNVCSIMDVAGRPALYLVLNSNVLPQLFLVRAL